MRRFAVLTLAVTLLGAACGSDDDDGTTEATTAPETSAAATESTEAPATTAAPTTVTPPPTTTPPTTTPETTTSTTAPPAARIPLPDLTTIVDESVLGEGFVLGASRTAPVAWLAAPADGPEVLGCEGLPAEALWAQTIDSDTRVPALPDDPDLVGINELVAYPDGRVLLVRACEGLFVDAWVGTDDGGGLIRDVEQLDLPDMTLFSTIRLGPDRLTYVEADPFGSTGGALVELDLATGTRTTLIDADVWDAVDLATGNLVYRTGTELFVDGFSLGSFPATGPFSFTFEPDQRLENVAVSVAGGLSVYVGTDDELLPVLGEDVAVLDWHPSGQALLVNGPFDPDAPTPPRMVLLDGTAIPLPVDGDVVGGAFTADGRSVVLTGFLGGETTDLVSRAFTFAG